MYPVECGKKQGCHGLFVLPPAPKTPLKVRYMLIMENSVYLQRNEGTVSPSILQAFEIIWNDDCMCVSLLKTKATCLQIIANGI